MKVYVVHYKDYDIEIIKGVTLSFEDAFNLFENKDINDYDITFCKQIHGFQLNFSTFVNIDEFEIDDKMINHILRNKKLNRILK